MIKHVSYAIERFSSVIDYLKRVDHRLDRQRTESFHGAVEGFDDLICPDLWDRIYASAVTKTVDDPEFNGGLDWVVQGFVLCESDGFHFSMRCKRRSELGRHNTSSEAGGVLHVASLAASPSVLFVIGKRPVTFNVFRLPEQANLDVFDPSVTIELCGQRKFSPWVRIDIDAPRETLEVSAESEDGIALIELAMKPTASQRWEFDRLTGIPIGAVLLSRESVILRAMLEEVRRFKYMPAIGSVVDLIDHPDFNIRWESAKCAFCLDQEVGIGLIRRLVSDVNPHVSSLANKVVSSFDTEVSHAD